MTFKDQFAEDLPTFLNVDEFADSVNFDGVTMACVLEGNGDTVGGPDGVINQDIVVRTREANFAAVPVVGQRVELDGEPADVIAVNDDQGMLEIRLRWWDS